MTSIKDGRISKKVMYAHRKGLNYLTKTGFNVRISDSTWKVNLKDVIERLGEKSLDEKTGLLPIPYTIGTETLSEQIMEVYNIRTKNDLAAYVRVVGIIISHFEGPDKYNHLDTFVNRLKVIFETKYGSEQAMIIHALKIYEEHTGKREINHQILSVRDYISLARILNAQYDLYDDKQALQGSVSILDNMTIERLGKKLTDIKEIYRLFKVLISYEIINPVSIEEFRILIKTPEYRIKLMKQIKAYTKMVTNEEHGSLKRMFNLLFCKLTEESLLQKLNSDTHVKSLYSMLDFFLIYPVSTKEELKSLANKPDERAKLLRIIQNFCKREFGE